MGTKLIQSLRVLKKIDLTVSRMFIYYAATLGFILGWISVAIFLNSIYGEIPYLFTLLLRFFYFLLSFLFGLKITIKIMKFFRKRN